MKKLIGIGLIVATVLAFGVSFASADDEVVATSTPIVAGSYLPFIAGSIDSINGKGAWFISNKWDAPYVPRQIYYVSEHPEFASVWKNVMEQIYHTQLP